MVARADINITRKASFMLTDNSRSLINIISIPYHLVLIRENFRLVHNTPQKWLIYCYASSKLPDIIWFIQI